MRSVLTIDIGVLFLVVEQENLKAEQAKAAEQVEARCVGFCSMLDECIRGMLCTDEVSCSDEFFFFFFFFRPRYTDMRNRHDNSNANFTDLIVQVCLSDDLLHCVAVVSRHKVRFNQYCCCFLRFFFFFFFFFVRQFGKIKEGMDSIVERMETSTSDNQAYVENVEASIKTEQLELEKRMAAEIAKINEAAEVANISLAWSFFCPEVRPIARTLTNAKPYYLFNMFLCRPF